MTSLSERIIDCFFVSYDEYLNDPNIQLDKFKDFFVLKDKSILDSKENLNMPYSKKWARGLVRNLLKR